MSLKLEPSELQLLAWCIPNEVINGFKVDNFQQQLGVSQDEFKKKVLRLRETQESEQVTLTDHETQYFRNALSITLDELGLDEFQTRTGIDFDAGLKLLQKMNLLLNQQNESESLELV